MTARSCRLLAIAVFLVGLVLPARGYAQGGPAAPGCSPDADATKAAIRDWQAAISKYEAADWRGSIPLFEKVQNYFARCALGEPANSARYNHMFWRARALYYEGSAWAQLGNEQERERCYEVARSRMAMITAAKDVARNADIDAAHTLLLKMPSQRANSSLNAGIGERNADANAAERLFSEAYTNGHDDGDLGVMLGAAWQLGSLGMADGMEHSLWLSDQALGNVVALSHNRRDCQALLGAQAVAETYATRRWSDALVKYRNGFRGLANKALELYDDLNRAGMCAKEATRVARYVPASVIAGGGHKIGLFADEGGGPSGGGGGGGRSARTTTFSFGFYDRSGAAGQAEFASVRGETYTIQVSGVISFNYIPDGQTHRYDPICEATGDGPFVRVRGRNALRINDAAARDYTSESCNPSHSYTLTYTADSDRIHFRFENWNTRSNNTSGSFTIRISPK